MGQVKALARGYDASIEFTQVIEDGQNNDCINCKNII